eukprot:1159010-Pelagomonas_calceolata.AAC.11
MSGAGRRGLKSQNCSNCAGIDYATTKKVRQAQRKVPPSSNSGRHPQLPRKMHKIVLSTGTLVTDMQAWGTGISAASHRQQPAPTKLFND